MIGRTLAGGVAVAVVACLLGATGETAHANSIGVTGVRSAATRVVGPATAQQLAPAACGAARIAALGAIARVNSTSYTVSGSTNTLVLGRNIQSTITGGGGGDCIVGGGGLDTIAGGAGSDACLGPAGTTFITAGSNKCEVTGTH